MNPFKQISNNKNKMKTFKQVFLAFLSIIFILYAITLIFAPRASQDYSGVLDAKFNTSQSVEEIERELELMSKAIYKKEAQLEIMMAIEDLNAYDSIKANAEIQSVGAIVDEYEEFYN